MYIPIIKTTAAELKGFTNLSEKVKHDVLPLFELTRDRTHKVHYPEGRLEKALEKALATHPGGRMIIDLTAHEDLINSEIERMFDFQGGYNNWCSFIEEICQHHSGQIIPTIQIDADHLDESPEEAVEQIQAQVRKLKQLCGSVVFRGGIDSLSASDFEEFITIILNALPSPQDLKVIIDCGYIKPLTCSNYSEEVGEIALLLKSRLGINNLVVCASSFPKSVTAPNYGDDFYGSWRMEEVNLYRSLVDNYPAINWVYSDYASVHPVRYESRGGTWIPRVDAPLSSEVFYYRKRRRDGGYSLAAQFVVGDPKFKGVTECWGRREIEKAARGLPSGRNPSHWISVRINIHITTQVAANYE